ncbi:MULTISPECIES: hypothetical protein [unclassified Facklamia]|uniref:hypothetical protein n=1 Tax=Aerococcaceae TaxID=186827 RepID=UPI0013B985A7|nr:MULTISPECIES: hypothetical protein [unclassified Facklamia]NEW65283.1 hypothetical protein [Facklamia sp. 252]NEW68737.1 hypothetical protein [Facklamia sp. 253]QQD66126.1 hypothetical protein JDW14_03195 [Aerococcaceae bacterium zg-252]
MMYITKLEREIELFKSLIVREIERQNDKIKQATDTTDELYRRQLNSESKLSLIVARVYNLEQRRPFPRKQKGRR